MKNKKGFTLVELLAVIVILALIMSIAVISITGVLESTRQSTFKETAASIIDGVKKQLLIKNELVQGDYEFTEGVLEKGGKQSPFGGDYTFAEECTGDNAVVAGLICRVNTDNSASCGASETSFVRISSDKTASICLAAGANNKYINVTEGTEANLLNNNNFDMIYPKSSS